MIGGEEDVYGVPVNVRCDGPYRSGGLETYGPEVSVFIVGPSFLKRLEGPNSSGEEGLLMLG